MTDVITASLDGVAFGVTDDDGLEWTIGSLDGWWNGPAGRGEPLARPAQRGSYPLPGTPGDRAITMGGLVRGRDRAPLVRARDTITAILADGRYGELAFTDPDIGTRYVLVRLATAGTLVDLQDAHTRAGLKTLTYQITLVASESVLFGPTYTDSVPLAPPPPPGSGWQYPVTYPVDWGDSGNQATSSMPAPNDGTATSFPLLRINGPASNPVLVSDGGDELRFTRFGGLFIPAGQYADIDCAARTVLLNGTSDRRYTVKASGRSWLAVPPGGLTISWRADGYDPAARLTEWVRSAWW